MLVRLFTIAFSMAAVVYAGKESPSTTKVSAAVKDTSVSGIEGFNINIEAPFKVQDYIVGFQYRLGDIKKAPEYLFAKRTFDTVGDGKALVDLSYNLADKALNVFAKWNVKKFDVELEAEGDTQDYLKTAGFSKDFELDEGKVTLVGAYDFLKQKIAGSVKFGLDKARGKVTYDTESQDPVLEVGYDVDSENELAPAISLKSGKLSYGWTRKWTGGSLKSEFFPGDKFAFEWKDEGASGTWTTKASVPLDNTENTRVSFSRDWNY